MPNEEELRCCPFCGGHHVDVCRTNPDACWVRCCDCGSDSESHATREGAFRNWNRRRFDDEPAAIVDDDGD